MNINGTEYRTILLDTNIIREFLFNDSFELTDLKKKEATKLFFLRFFSKEKSVILISIYSFLELEPYKDLYTKFITLFSSIPIFVVLPERFTILKEYESMLNGVIYSLNDKSNEILYSLSLVKETLEFFNHNILSKIYTPQSKDQFIIELSNTAKSWEEQRLMQSNSLSIAEYRKTEYANIVYVLSMYVGLNIEKCNLTFLPGLRLMKFCARRKIQATKKAITKNDVVDVKICCIVPYVDYVVVEKQQANFYKEAKTFIPQVNNVTILTLSDIRSLD